MPLSDAERERRRADFVIRFVLDAEQGRLRSEEDYRRLFPEVEDLVSAEWQRLSGGLNGGAADPRRAADGAGATPEPARARTFGPYRLDRELGRGGQGTVLLAWDPRLGRHVALKILKASWAASDAMRRRFELEASLLARLDHPGLAGVHDVGSIHGLDYLVMPYVEGRTLASEIAARTAPPSRAEVRALAATLATVARAAHAAHEAGVIHRDIKPANIMLAADRGPVLLDFGIARLLLGGRDLTVTGDVLGTPTFMAPEQVSGPAGAIDRRADVYGLGATLHDAFTAAGPSPRAHAVRGSARASNRCVPRALDAVLQAALDSDPDRRYSTAAELADDLERALAGAALRARPPGPIRRFATWCRRKPAAAALVIIPPVLIACGIGGLAAENRKVAAAATELSDRAREADDAAAAARARFAEMQRLNDLRKLDALDEKSWNLWPVHPNQVRPIERWIADAREVAARLGEHRAALAAVRRRALPLARDPATDPRIGEAARLRTIRDATRARAAPWPAGDPRHESLGDLEAEAGKRLAEVESRIAAEPVWHFADPEDQWLHGNLERLVARLERLAGDEDAPRSIRALQARLAKAAAVEEQSVGRHADAWRAAVAAIADRAANPAYGGLVIAPIVGLVPLGRDPASSLWEFAHVLSGTLPSRDSAGKLVVTEASAIVLVLVPPGSFEMGARVPDEDEEPGVDNHDPSARPIEGPVTQVALDAYFISKYELTQGQWERLTTRNPSHHCPDKQWQHGYHPNLTHPVEQVSYEDCEAVLWRVGLEVPTEAQWERAARAGTATPFWCGRTGASLLRSENLVDRTLLRNEAVSGIDDEGRDDGWSGPAPVGSFPPNPFGLHDTIGNVSEWSRDRAGFYVEPPLPGDGLRTDPTLDARLVRGGAWNTNVERARASWRDGTNPSVREAWTGVRPSLSLPRP